MENEKKLIIDLTEYQELIKFKEETEKGRVIIEDWEFVSLGMCWRKYKTSYISKEEALKKLENHLTQNHNKEISEKNAEIQRLNDEIAEINNVVEEIKNDFNKYTANPIGAIIKKFFKRK